MELFGGAALSAAVGPPADALEPWDTVRLIADEKGVEYLGPDVGEPSSPQDLQRVGRSLCDVCRLSIPHPETDFERVRPDDCAKCGCWLTFHESELRYLFASGCSMAWADALHDEDGELLQVGLVHCRCDGYVAPPEPRKRRAPPEIPPY